MSIKVYKGFMDMYEMLGLVLTYMLAMRYMRNIELILNCKQMNIIDVFYLRHCSLVSRSSIQSGYYWLVHVLLLGVVNDREEFECQ